MSGPWLPGYDAWKLATPPEYERDDDTCEDCRGVGILEDWCAVCGLRADDCLCENGPRAPECRSCGGTGDPRGRLDPDAAYDAERDEAI